MDPKLKPVRLVDAAGDELGALLGSIAPQTFVHEYWGKKPLLVKGFPEKFKGFFDLAAFFKEVANPGAAPAGHLRASFDKKVPAARSANGEPVLATQNFAIPPELAGPALRSGGDAVHVRDRHPRPAPRLIRRRDQTPARPPRLRRDPRAGDEVSGDALGYGERERA